MAATAQQLAIINLYTALFNRAPDAAGLDFWSKALSNGASLASITQGFLTTPEALVIYPAAQTSEQFVGAFYQAVFGRVADAGGLKFWTDALNAAGGPSSAAAKSLIVSQINDIVSTPLYGKPANLTDAQYAETMADRATFANKVAVSVYFAVDIKSNDVALAKQALAGVNANTSSVNTAKLVIDTPAGGAPVVPARVLVGTDGADTFDLTHLTIAAGDSVDGGDGADTLNYVDSSTSAATFPAATVKNVETINIRNLNTAGTSFENVLFQVWSNLADGKTLSIAGLTVTANGVATSANVVQAFITGATVGNAVVSGSLIGYKAAPLGSSLTLTSTTLGNVPDLVLSGTGTASASFMTAQGMNGAIATVTAGAFAGATSFNSDRSTAGVAFTGLIAGQSLGLIGDNASVNGSLTGTYAGNVTEVTVNVSGGTKQGGIIVNGTGVTGVVVNSTGQANSISSLLTPASATALQINAAVDLISGGTGSIGTSAMRTITVSGNAATVGLGTVASTVLTSIDASGLTAGGVVATIGAAPAATFIGGAGKDVVTIVQSAVITGTIDGGAGTADTIGFQTASSLTAGTASLITHFEVLQVSALNGVEVYDASLIAGITKYQVGMSFSKLTLTKLAAAPVVTVTGGVSALSLELLNTAGGTDSVDLTLDNGATASSTATGGASVTALQVAGVETLKLHSRGLLGSGMGSNVVINDLANTALGVVVIDGDQALEFTVGTLVGAQDMNIDASLATGAVTVEGSSASTYIDVKGGTASDTIRVGTGASTVFGGAGGDAITLGTGLDRVIYKAAGDSLQDHVNAAGTAAGKMDTIVSFTSGTDRIDLATFAFADDAKAFVTKTFGTVDALLAAEGQLSFYVNDDGLTRGVVAAQVGTDMFLVVDANKDGVFDAASDLVVKMVGVTALQLQDVVFNAAP
jgi:hypothetical protein